MKSIDRRQECSQSRIDAINQLSGLEFYFTNAHGTYYGFATGGNTSTTQTHYYGVYTALSD